MGGWLSMLWPAKPMKALMLGLDNAGKTTVLNQLNLGETTQTTPTIGFNLETVTVHGNTMTVWDVGGQNKIRSLWKHYYTNTTALIYVVDCSDRERIEESKSELESMLREDELKDVAVLVYANKQDIAGAMPSAELMEVFDMRTLAGTRKWFVQPSVATTGNGLTEGFDWVCKAVNEA